MLNDYDVLVLYPKAITIGLFKYLHLKKILKKTISIFPVLYDYPRAIGVNFYQIRQIQLLGFTIFPKKIERINYGIKVESLKKYVYDLKQIGFIPNIIHAQCVSEAGIIAHYISSKLSIPYLITEHNYFNLSWFSDFDKSLIKSAFENANVVLVVSEYQKKQLLINGIDVKPLVIGNLVNDDLFKLSPIKYNNQQNFKIFIYTYNAWKCDLPTLFSLLSLMSSNYENIEFHLLISFIEKNDKLVFGSYFNQLPNKNSIFTYYDLPRDKVNELMNKCHLLVNTSMIETFGVTPCEFLLTGKPIISSDNGGADEYINNFNGLRVSSRCPEDFESAIIKLRDNYFNYNSSFISFDIKSKFGKDAFRLKLNNVYENLNYQS